MAGRLGGGYGAAAWALVLPRWTANPGGQPRVSAVTAAQMREVLCALPVPHMLREVAELDSRQCQSACQGPELARIIVPH